MILTFPYINLGDKSLKSLMILKIRNVLFFFCPVLIFRRPDREKLTISMG
jgi:hypothetical protein